MFLPYLVCQLTQPAQPVIDTGLTHGRGQRLAELLQGGLRVFQTGIRRLDQIFRQVVKPDRIPEICNVLYLFHCC